MTGYTLSDLGETLPWGDFKDFVNHLPPTPASAFYRHSFPESWWWTPELDFLGAAVTAVQWGNWQRGGGKGDKPRRVTKPVDKPRSAPGTAPTSAEDLKARKQQFKERMARGN